MIGSRIPQWREGRLVLAGLLALLIGALNLLAASQCGAHAQAVERHHDANTCFVCQFSHGKLDQPAPGGPAIRWNPQAQKLFTGPPHISFAPTEVLLPSGRAPPGSTLLPVPG